MHEISCPHHHVVGGRKITNLSVLCVVHVNAVGWERQRRKHTDISLEGGVPTNILYMLGDTWRNPTLHWTLGGTPHCTEHLEITITSLLSLLPSALTEGRVLEHSCQWDLGRNSQMCDFLFLWLHCWLFKGNIHF